MIRAISALSGAKELKSLHIRGHAFVVVSAVLQFVLAGMALINPAGQGLNLVLFAAFALITMGVDNFTWVPYSQ